MMKKTIIIAVTSLALMLTVGGTAFSEVGVTDTEIHIGQWSPQSGPAAPWGAVARGTDAYFKMINAQGGIHGRKLVHHFFDDAYNPAKTKAGVKQLQEQEGMFCWVSGVGTAPGLAVRDYLMERKIPWVGPSAGSRHWVDPPFKYLFNVYPLYLGDAQVLCQYAVKEMDKKRVAIAYQNDDYGKQGLEGATFELAKYGMELVEAVPVSVTDTDMIPHVNKLKQANADTVLLFVTPGHVARIMGTAKAMKFEPQWMSTTTCGDFPLMMHITKGAYEGVITASFGVLEPSGKVGQTVSLSNPSDALKKYKEEAFEKFAAQDERWGYTFCAGIAYAEPLVKALEMCGRDLTREKLVQALEDMNDFEGLMGDIDYKPFDPEDPLCRIGQDEVFLQQCMANGESLILTDWVETTYLPREE